MSSADPTEALGQGRLRWIRPAILVGVPLMLVLPTLLSGDLLFGEDVVGIFYYARAFATESLRSGHLPMWDSTSLAGFPFVACGQSLVFYPPAWLSLLLPAGLFWTLSAALHLSLSGFFAELWLRRGLGLGAAASLLGGLIYMGSGYVAGHLYGGHVHHVYAYAWMPAILAGLELFLAEPGLKRGVLLGVPAAMPILAGVTQYFVFASGVVALRLVHFILESPEGRRDRLIRALQVVGWMAWAVLLCAVQVLPTMELLPRTLRASAGGGAFFTQYSVPPENFLTLIAPRFFGDEVSVPYWGRWFLWEICGFVGIATLLLASFAPGGSHRQRRLWVGVAGGALLLALGRYGFLYPALSRVVPGAGLFRVPGRFLLLFTLAATALAAMGFDRLRRDAEPRRAPLWWGAGVAAAGSAAVLVLRSLLSPERWPGILDWARTVTDSGLVKLKLNPAFPAASLSLSRFSLLWAAIVLGLIAAVLVSGAARRWSGWAIATALAVLIVADLLAFNHRFFVRQSEEGLRWPPEFVRFLKGKLGDSYRLAALGPSSPPVYGNCQVAGIDFLGGYEPMMLRSYGELINVIHGDPIDKQFVHLSSLKPDPSLNLLGARLWWVHGTIVRHPSWTVVAEAGGGIVYENADALPRAWLVDHAVVQTSAEERLRTLTRGPLDPRKTVLLHEMPGDLPPPATGNAGNAAVVSRGPGRYEIDVEARGDAYLVLSEAWFPGWTAEIDGRAAEVLPADHLIQAVRVPPGRHAVRFQYRSRFLPLGLLLTASALIVPAVVGRLRRVRPAAA